ncbi:spherulation-specific family 4 protein [Kitasatospora sp. NPDC101183]|uniref:spherulation-specific family 4 protein n=1 Tax=Kitasatospora sp. NPDC101183 TaxID=3364100 RepID=UPI00380ED268
MAISTMAAGIPMYVHPGIDGRSWATLATVDQPVRYIVLNQDSGPGEIEDGVLYDAARAVKAGGVTKVCGYIDYAYGNRAGGDYTINQDAAKWVSRGIDCVFLDRVPSTAGSVQPTAVSVLGLRKAGMKFVAMNYGVLPAPGHLDIGDIAVVFEGDMATYRTLSVPSWVLEHEPERLAHLVYEASQAESKEAIGLARQRGVHNIFCTDKTFASGNPWSGVPLYWSDEAKTLKAWPARPAPGWLA